MSTRSEKIDQLVTALIKAQSQITGALKESSNPYFKSKYADLESCWEAVKPALQSSGLAIVQTMGIGPSGPELHTMLAHSSGQFIEGVQPVCPKTNNNPQDLGSAITYARRYGLAAIVGLVQVDDDGNAGSGRVVRPDQPSASEGIQPGGWTFPSGKLARKRPEECATEDLKGLVDALKEKYPDGKYPARAADAMQYAKEELINRDEMVD